MKKSTKMNSQIGVIPKSVLKRIMRILLKVGVVPMKKSTKMKI